MRYDLNSFSVGAMMKKILLLLILITSIATAKDIAIDIRMLGPEQNIPQLLQLQKQMHMSAKPKSLSKHPQAICFQANIDQFLPKNKDMCHLKPIFGCVFSDQVAMNSSLLRAGLFVHTQMGMTTDEQLFSSNLMQAVGGHDFDGEELYKYHQQAVVPKESANEHKDFKDIEADFNQKVISPIIQQHKKNFIFFAIINTKKYKENLSHELLHAQYYIVPQIKPILKQEWDKVTPSDQKTIVDALRNGGYDMEQQDLLLREFYSYFLQYNAKQYLAGIKVLAPMAGLADVYGTKILAALTAANIKVLSVN
jgi:hypothetical protein